MNFQKNQILETEIIDTNILGFGVCKIGGAVVFVQNGVAGDRVKIRIIKCAKNYYVARIEEMIFPSEFRAEPRCSHYRRCGGCSFQHVDYEYEKALKRSFVQDCFRKVGLSEVEVLPVLSTNRVSAYRNKGQFPLSLSEDGGVISGFFAPKTHRVCKIDHCDIQDPLFSDITSFLCDYFTKNKIAPYNEEDHSGLLRHIYLRSAKVTSEIMLCLILREDSFPEEAHFAETVTKRFPEIKSISFNIQSEKNNVILGKKHRHIWGEEKICDFLCEKKLMISPMSFYQVNHDATEILYKKAFEMADLQKFDLLVDLYCGIGSISLSSSAKCPIVGIEIIEDAVKDARENAIVNNVTNASFYCGDATDAFKIIKDRKAKNPLIVLDPPRKGLSAELIRDISENMVSNILYISCGPDTFARDLLRFSDLGYKISPIQPVDLFPRTGHVECIAFLTKDPDQI